jgi:putative ABC transport system permease protein
VIFFAIAAGLLVIALLVGVLYTVGSLLWLLVQQWRDVISIDRWSEVLVTIRANKLRTALTTISVAWGIFVLVFLLGLGRGLNQGARKQFAREATNGVWMIATKTSVPYGGYDVGRHITFDNRDYDRAKNVKGVEHISGQYYMTGGAFDGTALMTKRGGKANSFQINAVHADAFYLTNHEIIEGRFLTKGDVANKRKSVVVGRPVVEYFFKPDEDPIGQWLEVAGVPFQIVGVFRDEGGAEQERQMYVPVSTAQLAFSGNDKLGMLELTAGNAGPEEVQAIVDTIKGQLSERHGFSPDDPQAVHVHNNVEQFQRFSMMFYIISAFVLVIGLGTLSAGVVGVSNIMMIAVKERTKEIGVRKALGATPSSIVFMVIQEAVFLTGIAGLLGLSAGVAACEGIGRAHLTGFILNPGIDLSTGIVATLFLVFAGTLAGFFPARAAARVNPIHALRDQ